MHPGGFDSLAAAWRGAANLEVFARRPFLDPRLLWATLALVGALLLGALVIWWVERWRRRPPEPPESATDQLAHFRKLYDRGVLSAEEFQRIHALLSERLRQELAVSPAPPPEDSPPQVPKAGPGPG
jgi:hypothetical protein